MSTEQNELVQIASKYAGDVKPHVKKIVGVAIIVAVGLLALMFLRQRGKLASERSWTGYFAAVGQADLDGLYEVANKYPRTTAGAWALQSAGDINLATGTVNMYSDRAEARERLLAAKEDFQQAEQRAKEEMLRQRALMGLAQTHEALNEFDDAESAYNRVIDAWPSTAISDLARDRLAVLTDPETRQFYDWFMEQEIEPPKNPLGDIQLDTPSVYDDLPSDPQLTMPDPDALDDSREFMQPPEEGADIEETEVPAAPDAAEIEAAPAAEAAPE